jgi:hypothetical protein
VDSGEISGLGTISRESSGSISEDCSGFGAISVLSSGSGSRIFMCKFGDVIMSLGWTFLLAP